MRARVEFLESTLELLRKWDLPVLGHVKLWRLLCFELQKSLIETHSMVAQEEELTENFDIYELTLRRYYQNIAALSCVHTHLDAADSIVDPDARRLWISHFGTKRSYVSWDLFHPLICTEQTMRPIKFLINFPDDGIISVYKFDLLVRVFGPTRRDVNGNVKDYACGLGFAGMINRIHARRLLVEQFNRAGRAWYLIRLSRTEPEFLVFSQITAQGQVMHLLHRKGSLAKVVRKMQNDFSCLPVRLLPEIFENKSLHTYASYTSGYCVISTSSSDGEEAGGQAYYRPDERPVASVQEQAAPEEAEEVAAAPAPAVEAPRAVRDATPALLRSCSYTSFM